MAIHSGTLSVSEIEKYYNVGFLYAQNIADELERIGYIKKSDGYGYLMIQTEKAIYEYVSTHKEALKPKEYTDFGLKDNGNDTFKNKVSMFIQVDLRYFFKVSLLKYVCRFLFSIASLALFVFMCFVGIKASKPLSEIILVSGTIYIYICIPLNLIYGLLIAKHKGLKFKEFMLRPWLHERVKTVLEIHNIMRNSNIKFKVSGYYETLERLKIHLIEKKKLAEHYGNLANNADNESEFYQAINSCLEVLEWMAQFEKYGVYSALNKPSDDIKKIKDGMDISIERFNNRMKMSGKIAMDFDLMEGHDFEYFCANLLRENGFYNAEVTQGSGDHGIDVLAEKDGITYGIQCKCYSGNVGNDAVQQAHTGKSLYHRDIAVVMTNRYFTPQAQEEAKFLGVKLWDRKTLIEMTKGENR